MATSVNISTSPQELIDIQLGIAESILENSDPLAILDHMLGKLKTICDVDAVGVYFWNADEQKYLLRGHIGLDSNETNQLSVVNHEAWEDLVLKLQVIGMHQVKSWPITAHGEKSGRLVAASSISSGLSPMVQTVFQTVAANLGSMVVRSQTEAILRVKRHNLSTVFEKFEDFLFVVSHDGKIITCNNCRLGILGLSRSEIVDHPIARVLPGILSVFEQQYLQVEKSQSGEMRKSYQGKLLDKNNRLVPVEICVSKGLWDDNDVWYVTCRDVSEHQAMERERNHLARAVEQTSESIVITNAEGSITYVNPAFTKLTGYSREEVLGANPRILKSGQHSREFYSDLWGSIRQGITWNGRIENKRKDGSIFIEEASISAMKNDDGIITHFIAVKRDVSGEIDLENKLRESQKLEAIGTLAGGIAHDFNNILYALLGYGQLALDDISEDHPARIPLQEICKAGERATDLVDKMLTFGRRADSGREVLALKPVIEEALGLARASLPATIEFNLDLQDNCPAVLANPTQMHQVVLNLCTNAEYALRNTSGTLSISLKECQTGMDEAQKYANLPSGKWLSLTVSDTGVGMDQAVVDRIFEPYFTTKKAHEGTGLGLATAHGIIKSHDGHIYVDSTPGQGTSICIFLPVSMETVPNIEEPPVSENPEPGEKNLRQGNILIIDDEEMIVEILCKALPRMGHEVAGFTEGIKALEVFRASPNAFDLVITDQTMPHITGFELAAELLSIRPDLPIVLTTGYSEQAGKKQAENIGISRLVSKPLKISELSEIVNDLLGKTVKL